MKFGKYISSVSQEWATHYYINYKGLKKIISSHEVSLPGDESNKTAFFYRLERELEKVNTFYLQKEVEFKLRLETLNKKKQKAKERNTLENIKEAFLQFQLDLAKLQKFVQLNATGFRKILKKWDKRAKSSTKEIYLSRQIEVQPCFNTEVLTDLADQCASTLIELDKLLETSLESTNSKHLLRHALSEIQPILTHQHHLELKEWLKKDYNLDKEFYSKCFLSFCTETSIECLLVLLEYGVDLNLTDDISDATCLHELAIEGKLEIIKLVVERGGDINAVDVYGRTPLHYSCLYGHDEVTLFLLSKGANVNAIDRDENSPLINAIIGGHTKCAYTLIEQGASIEPVTPNGSIPLSIACQYGHLEIVDLLLSKNVSLLTDLDGLDPLHIACREGKDVITKRLIDFKSDIEKKDSFYGWSAVFFAAQEGHLECIRILLDAGCDISTKDQEGWLPWTYALYRGHVKVAALLKVKQDVIMEEVKTKPLAPSEVFLGEPMNLDKVGDLDIEDIPSLSLPPPIIPLRIYGHHYLDNKVMVQIQIGEYGGCCRKEPVNLFGSRQLSSLRLKITCKPEVDLALFANLPLKDAITPFNWTVDDLSLISFEFDIYPAFGTKAIGRASCTNTQLLSILKTSRDGIQGKEIIVSIFDSHLKVIGDFCFSASIIKPFNHPSLLIGGKIETYWKSTTVVSNPNPKTSTEPIHSLITASSLAEEYVELVVQSTKDGQLVVYPHSYVLVNGLNIPLNFLDFQQAKSLFEQSNPPKLFTASGNPSDLASSIYQSFMTFEQVLKVSLFLIQRLPTSIGVSVILKYPSQDQLDIGLDMNLFVDSILQIVYDHSNQRSIIFSSFNQSLCTIMNWKQPNYGVFFRTYCGFQNDSSIKEAVKFCKKCDLLGMICFAQPFVTISNAG
ncbi:phosphate system positive regulatory protein pho81 [Boothiomyces macroporosus]|uniref:Phosphate system positive regulatory protein pho81 n=1 Tax=Boothiomyces macroporosus TaxID=261099 RepID=A0AAD5Y2W9_9FUNG|nr:phosphate system positive regulatory protein pho81 [Boothiomyces macroporosus]